MPSCKTSIYLILQKGKRNERKVQGRIVAAQLCKPAMACQALKCACQGSTSHDGSFCEAGSLRCCSGEHSVWVHADACEEIKALALSVSKSIAITLGLQTCSISRMSTFLPGCCQLDTCHDEAKLLTDACQNGTESGHFLPLLQLLASLDSHAPSFEKCLGTVSFET